MTPADALGGLWREVGGDPAALGRVRLTGEDPVLPSTLRVGTAAGATLTAVALAADELRRQRTGRGQDIALDLSAAAAGFRSERYLRVDGRPPSDVWSAVSGFYRTADEGWIQLHCNFPHHRDGVLRLLGCEGTRDAVATAVARWKGGALEDALAAAGMCAGLVRPREEWRRHPHGAAVARLPLVEITRIGDAPPEAAGHGDRPLAGVRVLDLTRVIAGPVCGRALAEHGADVMLVTAPHLPSIEALVIDTGRGKLAAHLDLRQPADAERLRALLRRADVFVQSYRPGALAGRGWSVEEVARLRPGIVYVTLSAYGHAGPWRERRGFDSLVQSVSGIVDAETRAAGAARPRHLPAAALDHASGQLMALGALTALARRAREGGSWLVRVALARTGRWVEDLGPVDGIGLPDPAPDDVADLLEESDSAFGRLRVVRPVVRMSETPPRLDRPAAPLGTHAPVWPA